MSNQDREHLELLKVFHYVHAGLLAVFALFPIFHVGFGLFFVLNPEAFESSEGELMPPFFGWMFLAVGGSVMIMGWITSFLVFLSARFLGKRKNYMYCMVIAGLQCLSMPMGTALGVFTIIVMLRDTVKDEFGYKPS